MSRDFRPLAAADIHRMLDAAKRGESLSPAHTLALLGSHVYWQTATAELVTLTQNAGDDFAEALSKWTHARFETPRAVLT